jgi:two-component system KDP operon response regulator KdpE
VLVVDDDPEIRLLLQISLEADGFEVIVAADGAEGLERIAADAPDVVLLDVMMPVLDGWGVLDALDTSTAPPIIVISGWSNHDRAPLTVALEKGAVDFVPKPFDMDALPRIIEHVANLTRDALDAERTSKLQSL